MTKTNAQYWGCQIAGWGAYTAVGLLSSVPHSGWRPSIVIGYMLFFLYGIGLTHLLRALSHRRHWASLPLPRTLASLASASLAIAAVQTALVVGVYTAIEGRMGIWSEPPSVGYMFLGLSIIDTIWTSLYLAITTLRNSRRAKDNEKEIKLALGKAELRALEAQLNPHFLFNCLNSIRGMVSENPSQAQDRVTRLANILRYSLQKDRQHTVPLATEMEAVSDYLALELVRFEDRLRIHVEAGNKAGQASVPPMLLQTLVENAIKHGVEEIPSGGDLFIRAGIEGGSLRIEVENTGNLGVNRPGSTRIGLTNARERLRLLYGERANLQVAVQSEGRVTATVLMPATA